MIKKIFLVSFAIFISYQAQSQFHIGIKGGLNYINIVFYGDFENDNIKYRLGYHAVVFSSVNLSDKISINPELIFSNKGFKRDKDYLTGEVILHLNYLNLPLLAANHLRREICPNNKT